MIKKCCYRMSLEEDLKDNKTPMYQFRDVDCYDCCGYDRSCPHYIDITHLIGFRHFHLRVKLETKSNGN